MRNLKVGKKLIISYVVIMVLFIIGSTASILNFNSVGEKVEVFYESPFTVRGAANSASISIEAMQKLLYHAIITEDLAAVQRSIEQIEVERDNIAEQFPILTERFLGNDQWVDNLKLYYAELIPMNDRLLELAKQNLLREAFQYMEDNNSEVIDKIQKELELIIAETNHNGIELISEVRRAQTRAVSAVALFSVLSIIVSIGFAMYITHSITEPISELERAAESIADGNLDISITYESRDELGRLAKSMRRTVLRLSILINDLTRVLRQLSEGVFNIGFENKAEYVGAFYPLMMSVRQTTVELSDTMRQINSSSEQVSSGAEQVSSGAQTLAVGSGEQAATIEKLAFTMDGISKQIVSNANDAADVNKKAEIVGQEAEESNVRMKNLLGAMDNIRDSSSQIKQIIDTIEEIAFQTNILALNAKVEAARAGVSGKGFAVIADEIQALSLKSKEATTSTSQLVERSRSAVEMGVVSAKETAESLQKVVNGIQDIAGTIDKISEASQEQAESVGQVNQNISQISGIVQSNSATAEESAAASEELSSQAETLRHLVSEFQLRDEE